MEYAKNKMRMIGRVFNKRKVAFMTIIMMVLCAALFAGFLYQYIRRNIPAEMMVVAQEDAPLEVKYIYVDMIDEYDEYEYENEDEDEWDDEEAEADIARIRRERQEETTIEDVIRDGQTPINRITRLTRIRDVDMLEEILRIANLVPCSLGSLSADSVMGAALPLPGEGTRGGGNPTRAEFSPANLQCKA